MVSEASRLGVRSRGAETVATMAVEHAINRVILQSRSPSCGCGSIYDGTHTGQPVDGDGVLIATLESRRISVESIRETG